MNARAYGIAYLVRAVIYVWKMFMKSATKRHIGATTFSITTFSITTFNITTLSTKGLFATVSINDTKHKRYSAQQFLVS
jgi:hypothetical protein